MKAVTARPAEDSVDLLARIRRQFDDSAQLKLKAHDALAEPIAHATEIMVKCLLANGKILACGNGGSAADAQHFSAELLNRFERERPGLAAIALTTYGMPLVVEIGIFFDVVVAVMVLGILVFRIRETFASMDVSKLNELKW